MYSSVKTNMVYYLYRISSSDSDDNTGPSGPSKIGRGGGMSLAGKMTERKVVKKKKVKQMKDMKHGRKGTSSSLPLLKKNNNNNSNSNNNNNNSSSSCSMGQSGIGIGTLGGEERERRTLIKKRVRPPQIL